MTDLLGAEAQRARRRLPADPGEPLPRSRAAPSGGFFLPGGYVERSASFYYTGGLVGVHSAGRDRGAIWNALKRRETYGTSGPRILLWFDLLDRPSDPNALQASDPGLGSARVTPMGGEVAMGRTPRFRVRAVGALKQKPGCPEHVDASLGAERLEFLCRGECYHPSDERWRIDRIEVVRIRPQLSADEDPATLIDDPWRVIPCELDPAGCTVEFDDSTFAENERDTVYYVRAIQESTLQINGDGLRCERDTAGRCLQVRLCQANEKGSDDCLGPDEARAWSSPIFVDFEPEAGIEATLTEFARAH
jgi:hypothetical protein